MFFPWWLLGGALFGLLVQRFFDLWQKLDDETKKEIIETIIKNFEEIFRSYYKWQKQEKE